MGKLDAALALAAAGFKVFPVRANGKLPAVKGWQEWATTNPDKISSHWLARPEHNIGISTSENLLVVDVDPAKGGRESVLQLELEGFVLPLTQTQTTASGGSHYIFRVPHPIKQSVGKIGKGLDIRGDGGLIVGAGSTIDDKAYSIDGERIADAPQWLIDRCGRAVERVREDQPVPDNIDTPAATERAIHYLQVEAPLAVEGDGGDETTYKVAARLKDFGIGPGDARDLMLDYWNERCSPPWDHTELGHKVENAYIYGTNPPGAAAPETVFTVVTPEPKPQAKGLRFEMFHDIKPDLSHVALIQNLIDHRAMSVIYGDSNTGKTFFSLDLAFHIALGRTWHDRKVDRGAAVYVAAEGGGAIRKRVVAFRQHYGLDAEQMPFALVPCSVDLLNPRADTQPLIDLINNVAKSTGMPVSFVVIDTLARAIGGGNENASEDMGAFVRNIDRIREATGAHVMIVHHSGKDAAKGARGHSSLRAATDTEIEIADFQARANKQRDQELGKPIGFTLHPVHIGEDSYGVKVASCVVLPRAVTAETPFRLKHLKSGSLADDAWKTLENLRMGGQPVPLEAWQDAFIALRYPDMKHETAVRAFERVRLTLADRARVKDGWVENP